MEELLHQAVEAVADHGGNVAAAAKTLGVARSTLWDRVKKAGEAGIQSPAVSDSGQSTEKKRIAELERLVQKQQERIENLNKSKFKIPTSKGSIPKGDYVRIAVPDTHGCHADELALASFLGDLEALSPSVKEIVLLGDHLDCGGFLAQHWTLGYVAETSYTFEDDVSATNQFLDKIQELCPSAKIYYLEGNHERRLSKWCVTQALKNAQDAAYLQSLFGVDSVLSIEKRGIQLYEQGKFYDRLPIPATIRLGRCFFTHGSRTGQNPAKLMLSDFAGNVVFGHVHRMDSYTTRTVNDGVIGAWTPGCLTKLQPLWNHTQVTGWSHGYGMQLVRDNGDFLHVNVPIIDGKSYLTQLTDRVVA